MRQLIIVRKDLNMSTGKIAAQVAHASMAFISAMLKESKQKKTETAMNIDLTIDLDVWQNWFCDIYTKTVCEAKNRNSLLKCTEIAKTLDLKEGQDYFLVKDHCLTELEPEEIDSDGTGKTLTCIGFRPLPDDLAKSISKKYQLLR